METNQPQFDDGQIGRATAAIYAKFRSLRTPPGCTINSIALVETMARFRGGLYEQAMSQLIDSGYLKLERGGRFVRLTNAGYDQANGLS